MKQYCKTNCGNRVQVTGCKFCPECYYPHSQLTSTLQFFTSEHSPPFNPQRDADQEFLILNPCDGYHIAYAIFDEGTKKFESFCNFMRNPYPSDFYVAWAELPCTTETIEIATNKNQVHSQPNRQHKT